ncbi:MAG TPA: methyl-accepting chemotaxis protein, partial [bacterium]|nr:methyl-accepting chemotaxis protein [bacterium]
QFQGAYAEIVRGMNTMLDAILLPIGEGNRILAQISNGKIDELIAQTYKGDHEKMKLAVNNVGTVLQELKKELARLIEASKEGQLSERGKADQFHGAFGEIVLGVNTMLDAILLPIGEGNRILDQISVGKIDELIVQTYKGDHEKMKVAVNSVAITLQGLQKEMLRLTEASKDGLLGERGKAAQFKGAYAELVLGINQMLDAILLPIGEGNRILAHIASGKVDELIAQTYKGDHEKMKLAVNGVALALQALVADSVKLSKAAVDGRLDTRADASKHQGEYRSIVQGVNETLDAVLGPINEAAVVLDRMAAKDLTARVKGDYKGDHAKIKDAINTAAENLDKSMQQVAVGAEQVASATAQIGAGSQSLAQGSSEQASSIEEVSSSLQEMGSMTRQSVGNAKEAKTVAEQAKTAADKGVASMNLMSDAINKIKDSSDATAKIVKTIDEIAFQTNLLALNAAVEAARAGEAGKGFAVVAEEVRNLAMRSAEAAKNTANLIEGAVKNAENGVVLNQQVLLNFKEINDRANKVAEVVAEIAAASEQQDVGITQVNKAVEQMSQVTQQNAANAEESSSAAEELSSQSEEMRSMVANFTITGGAELSAAGKRAGHAAGHTVHSAPSNVVHLTGRDPKAALPLDEKDHRILKGF